MLVTSASFENCIISVSGFSRSKENFLKDEIKTKEPDVKSSFGDI